MGKATAPGKAILAGEHLVVHGTAALAVPLRARGVTVEAERGDGAWSVPAAVEPYARQCMERLGERPDAWTLAVETTLPVGAGLGGSAALAVALVRATAQGPVDDAEVRRRAHTLEEIAHGTPSGIDDAVATYDCPIFMSPVGSVEPLVLRRSPRLWVGVSADVGSTRDAVEKVRALAQGEPERFADLRQRGARLVARAHGALLGSDWTDLGSVMDAKHALLKELGVSTPALDRLCEAARESGAHGAKLTGAGLGGAMIAIAPLDVDLGGALRAAGATEVIAP